MKDLNKPSPFGIINVEDMSAVNIIYNFIKDRLPTQRDPDLVGRPIRVCDAAEKYGTSHANLSRWADGGMIRILNRQQKLLELDEGDVAFVTAIFKEAKKHTTSRRAAWVLKVALAQ